MQTPPTQPALPSYSRVGIHKAFHGGFYVRTIGESANIQEHILGCFTTIDEALKFAKEIMI